MCCGTSLTSWLMGLESFGDSSRLFTYLSRASRCLLVMLVCCMAISLHSNSLDEGSRCSGDEEILALSWSRGGCNRVGAASMFLAIARAYGRVDVLNVAFDIEGKVSVAHVRQVCPSDSVTARGVDFLPDDAGLTWFKSSNVYVQCDIKEGGPITCWKAHKHNITGLLAGEHHGERVSLYTTSTDGSAKKISLKLGAMHDSSSVPEQEGHNLAREAEAKEVEEKVLYASTGVVAPIVGFGISPNSLLMILLKFERRDAKNSHYNAAKPYLKKAHSSLQLLALNGWRDALYEALHEALRDAEVEGGQRLLPCWPFKPVSCLDDWAWLIIAAQRHDEAAKGHRHFAAIQARTGADEDEDADAAAVATNGQGHDPVADDNHQGDAFQLLEQEVMKGQRNSDEQLSLLNVYYCICYLKAPNSKTDGSNDGSAKRLTHIRMAILINWCIRRLNELNAALDGADGAADSHTPASIEACTRVINQCYHQLHRDNPALCKAAMQTTTAEEMNTILQRNTKSGEMMCPLGRCNAPAITSTAAATEGANAPVVPIVPATGLLMGQCSIGHKWKICMRSLLPCSGKEVRNWITCPVCGSGQRSKTCVARSSDDEGGNPNPHASCLFCGVWLRDSVQ
ncbi:unnamed protein product [Chrysoparadoxa australica]